MRKHYEEVVNMPVVEFNPGGIRVDVEKGSTLLQAIQKAGLPLASYCGGLGACGKCKVVVKEGWGNLNSLTKSELKLLDKRSLEENTRLACQARIEGEYVSIYIPSESMITSAGRSIAAVVLSDDVYPLNPVVKKIHIKLPKPTLEDNRPDLERLRDALIELGYLPPGQDLQVPIEILRELPTILRNSDWDVTAVMYENELIALEPGDTTSLSYGVAVDIGTSKIIVELVNLNTGESVGRESVENPQLVYGADVVSRIMYAEKNNENLVKLQRLAASAINTLIRKITERNRIKHEYIYEVVIVGNTVMHHVFYGIHPGFIARSPYVPVVSRVLNYKAEKVGLEINQQGYVSSLPVLRGFVGADAIADLLATQMHKRKELILVIDIGTNTEVLLGNSEIILAASAPSGPAFEGAHITHGMRAVPGAIGSVKINGLDIEYETIGGLKPSGICGTGLIDTIAELHRNGIINSQGKFSNVDHPRLIRDKDTYKFILVTAEESATGTNIYITPRDIESILLAKAAVRAAWIILSRKLGIQPWEIYKVYVSGSFGAKLNVDNAIKIGLLPNIEKDKVVFIGESSIVGAKIFLKSSDARREISEVVNRKIKYVELSIDPEFRDVYYQSIYLNS
ncbi:MAG: ASKHA domain-containing protein [Desulfurococcaceae archaeon]